MKTIDSKLPAFEVVPTIRGVRASLLSEDDIIQVINEVDIQIAHYTSFTTKTRVVTKRITDLKANLQMLVRYLDRKCDTVGSTL